MPEFATTGSGVPLTSLRYAVLSRDASRVKEAVELPSSPACLQVFASSSLTATRIRSDDTASFGPHQVGPGLLRISMDGLAFTRNE
jgi:hypothetical protein